MNNCKNARNHKRDFNKRSIHAFSGLLADPFAALLGADHHAHGEVPLLVCLALSFSRRPLALWVIPTYSRVPEGFSHDATAQPVPWHGDPN